MTILGFYNRIRQVTTQEQKYLAQFGLTDEQILRNASADQAWGEFAYSLYERTTIRPALSVNGISGGYSGPGGKAVIPARALAKLSFRLVPDQDPKEIDLLFRVTTDISHPAIRAAVVAYRNGFGASPVFLRSGGSIPVVNTFQETLGIPTVLMGFALPDDGMHAPNEKFHLPNFYSGIMTSMWFLSEVASQLGMKTPVVDGSSASALA